VFFLAEHHAMKAHWGSGIIAHAFFTSALDGDEWPASRPGRLTPREGASGTHWIGVWVGLRAVLDAVNGKIPNPRRDSNPRTPIVQLVGQLFLAEHYAMKVHWGSGDIAACILYLGDRWR
jgi:hypothetical protein